jgi:hypothetical protein
MTKLRSRVLEAVLAGALFSAGMDAAFGVSFAWLPAEAAAMAPGFFFVRMAGDYFKRTKPRKHLDRRELR